MSHIEREYLSDAEPANMYRDQIAIERAKSFARMRELNANGGVPNLEGNSAGNANPEN